MANPAELLLNLFRAWDDSSGNPVKAVRRDDSLREHRRAVGYLESIDKALELLENNNKRVSIYRNQFPTWVAMVFNYPRSWTQQNSTVMNTTSIDHLETLVDYVDGVCPKLHVDKIPVLLLYLDAVDKALEEDDSLPLAARQQVIIAVRHIRSYVEDIDAIDAFAFQRSISELFAALALAVLQSRNRSRWDSWAEKFVWVVVGDVFSTMTGGLQSIVPGAESILKSISAG